MQNFTLHCHTNSFGVFDGRSSVAEMINKAEELGFEAIGISNHLIWHPNMRPFSPMFFSDWNKIVDVFKRVIDEVKSEGEKHKIDVYVGAEVDFFPSKEWRNGFEKMLKELKFDYLIGSNHFLRNQDESFMCNLYHLNWLPENITEEEFNELVKNHWQNIIENIKSGYFNFLAHPDYCVIKIPDKKEYDEYRWQIVEALSKYHQTYEINTSGYNRINMQHPCDWMVEELCRRGVQTILSDDAHNVDMLGQHFARAENLLEKYHNQHRLTLDFLKK